MRGGDILENVSAVDTVIFDKTGTLTVGKPVVMNVVSSLDGAPGAENGIFAEDERQASHSAHPFSVPRLSWKGCKLSGVFEVQISSQPLVVPGIGVAGPGCWGGGNNITSNRHSASPGSL